MPREGKTARGRTYTRLALAERFWPKVDVDGPVVRPELGPCSLWKGSIMPANGYGCIRSEEGKTITAHLAAWLVAGKPRPPAGFELCHHCDVRACVRIDHLFQGTSADNSRDAAAKGRLMQQYAPERAVRGSAHGQSKLTEADVVEIRRLHAAGATTLALGERFRVSATMVGYIVRRQFWRHVS